MKTRRTTATQLSLRLRSCACGHCRCKVSVRSSVQVCKACRHGAHDLRTLRRWRGGQYDDPTHQAA